MKINTDQDIVDYLKSPLPKEGAEASALKSLLKNIEEQRDQSGDLSEKQQVLISAARTFASQTLSGKKDPRAEEGWNGANAYLIDLLMNNEMMTFPRVQKIQNLLTNSEDKVRTDSIYGTGEYISASYLKELIPFFEKEILLSTFMHPLIQAVESYIWLANLHPFPNANGRTARLVCDYFLLKNGFLPITFKRARTDYVAMVKNEFKLSKGEQIKKSLEAILRTYNLIHSKN